MLGQLTNTVDSGGTRVTNWFLNQSLRYAVTTASGIREYISFDDEDRATNTVDARGVSISMTYDNLGRMRTRGYPDGGIEKFGYSARGLIAYTNQLGLTNFYAYDEANRKRFETNANNELIRYTNNAAGDLWSLLTWVERTLQPQPKVCCEALPNGLRISCDSLLALGFSRVPAGLLQPTFSSWPNRSSQTRTHSGGLQCRLAGPSAPVRLCLLLPQ